MLWENGFNGCVQLTGKGFRVSYNPCTKDELLCEVMEKVTGIKMPVNQEETALIKGNSFFILTGDHRKAYEPLVKKGFQACMAYYQANISQRSRWSSDATEELLTEAGL